VPELGGRAPQGVLTYVRRFYYETALAPSPCSMAALRELVEPSHILFGSGYPFAPPPIVALECQTLEGTTGWPDAVKYGIDRGHALTLLPRYRGEGEVVTPAPIYRSESPRGRARRAMAKPLAALGQRVRNR